MWVSKSPYIFDPPYFWRMLLSRDHNEVKCFLKVHTKILISLDPSFCNTLLKSLVSVICVMKSFTSEKLWPLCEVVVVVDCFKLHMAFWAHETATIDLSTAINSEAAPFCLYFKGGLISENFSFWLKSPKIGFKSLAEYYPLKWL